MNKFFVYFSLLMLVLSGMPVHANEVAVTGSASLPFTFSGLEKDSRNYLVWNYATTATSPTMSKFYFKFSAPITLEIPSVGPITSDWWSFGGDTDVNIPAGSGRLVLDRVLTAPAGTTVSVYMTRKADANLAKEAVASSTTLIGKLENIPLDANACIRPDANGVCSNGGPVNTNNGCCTVGGGTGSGGQASVNKPNGETCSSSSQCASGHCAIFGGSGFGRTGTCATRSTGTTNTYITIPTITAGQATTIALAPGVNAQKVHLYVEGRGRVEGGEFQCNVTCTRTVTFQAGDNGKKFTAVFMDSSYARVVNPDPTTTLTVSAGTSSGGAGSGAQTTLITIPAITLGQATTIALAPGVNAQKVHLYVEGRGRVEGGEFQCNVTCTRTVTFQAGDNGKKLTAVFMNSNYGRVVTTDPFVTLNIAPPPATLVIQLDEHPKANIGADSAKVCYRTDPDQSYPSDTERRVAVDSTCEVIRGSYNGGTRIEHPLTRIPTELLLVQTGGDEWGIEYIEVKDANGNRLRTGDNEEMMWDYRGVTYRGFAADRAPYALWLSANSGTGCWQGGTNCDSDVPNRQMLLFDNKKVSTWYSTTHG